MDRIDVWCFALVFVYVGCICALIVRLNGCAAVHTNVQANAKCAITSSSLAKCYAYVVAAQICWMLCLAAFIQFAFCKISVVRFFSQLTCHHMQYSEIQLYAHW